MNLINDYKKYIAIYITAILILTFAMFNENNYIYWTGEMILIPALAIVGLITILYSYKNDLSPHKLAFILIIVFGLIMVFLAPPMAFPDEEAHFTRAELLSEGVLYPEYGDNGFEVNNYYFELNGAKESITVLDNPHIFDSITDNKGYRDVTTESPFYSYIPSMLGILNAKTHHLPAIFAMWFARLTNLLLYAVIAYFAIKKAPAYKVPLLVISTMPLVIAQVSSASYDAFILTFTLVILAYFIKMFKDRCENKDLLIFFISVLLISLIKPPYIMLSLLALAVPKGNFQNNRKYSLIAILIIFLLTLLSVGGILNSIFGAAISNSSAIIVSDISLTGQINYVLGNPSVILELVKFILVSIPDVFILSLSFYHYADFNGLKFFNILYFAFFILFSIFYRKDIHLTKKQKSILLAIAIICYLGIYGILYLQWTPVGASYILGIQARYFLPLIALLPLIIDFDKKAIENKSCLILAIVIFLSGLVLLTITHYY